MEVVMPSEHGLIPDVQTLTTGLLLGESPRWHDGRLWFADWGAEEPLAMDLAGRRDVILREDAVSDGGRMARVREHA